MDHRVLPATRQLWESRLYPRPKQVLDLANSEGFKAELTYVTWKPTGRELNPWPVNRKSNALPISHHATRVDKRPSQKTDILVLMCSLLIAQVQQWSCEEASFSKCTPTQSVCSTRLRPILGHNSIWLSYFHFVYLLLVMAFVFLNYASAFFWYFCCRNEVLFWPVYSCTVIGCNFSVTQEEYYGHN